MTARLLMAAVALLLMQSATAQIVTKINAVEASPANLILPADSSGMMTFRACDSDCDDVDYKRVQLSASTAFRVNGKAVKYVDFRRELAIIKRAPMSYALVTYETATNLVTKLEIAR